MVWLANGICRGGVAGHPAGALGTIHRDRTAPGAIQRPGPVQSLRQGFGKLSDLCGRNRVLRHIVAAGALISFTGYASIIWIPIYLVRIHSMGTGEVGSYLALMIGLGGALGIYLGGRLCRLFIGPPRRTLATLGDRDRQLNCRSAFVSGLYR